MSSTKRNKFGIGLFAVFCFAFSFLSRSVFAEGVLQPAGQEILNSAVPVKKTQEIEPPASEKQVKASPELFDAIGRVTTLSLPSKAELKNKKSEIPEVPEGWERAKSNPYFAFQLQEGFPNNSLSLQDLKTGKVQELLSFSLGQMAVIGKTYDVSPDGKSVVYEVRLLTGAILDESNEITIQSIADPSKKIVIKESSVRRQYVPDRGSLIKSIDYSKQGMKITLEVIDGPDQKATVLEKTYQVNTHSMKVSGPIVKLAFQGEDFGYSGFQYDSVTGLAIHKAYTNPRPFLDVYDASRGTDRMRLIARLQFDISGAPVPPQMKFLDYRFTNTSLYQIANSKRQFVTVSAITAEPPFPGPAVEIQRKTLVFDVKRNRKLELDGIFLDVQYFGPNAVYTLETAPGVTKQVTVNLLTMKVV